MQTMELSKTAQILVVSKLETALQFVGGYVQIFENKNYTSLRTIVKNIGAVDTKKTLYMLMGSLIKEAIEVEPDNIQHLIDNIIENYPDVSFEDVALFTKKVIRGEFIGKEVNVEYDAKGRKVAGQPIKVFKYDVPTLCLMFQRYYAERIEAYEEKKQQESNQHKMDSTMHPEVINLFKDAAGDIDSYNGIYIDLKTYCDHNEIDQSVFIDSYSKLYNEYVEQTNIENAKINFDELTDEEIDKVIATVISLDDFIKSKTSQFLVIQNKIKTGSNINSMSDFSAIVLACQEYEIDKLTKLCKELGLWMIPTKYYYAAKQLIFEGGEIKYRYDITERSLKIINTFIEKALQDKSIGTTNLLFVLSMILNFTLHLMRFNKYNGAGNDKA